MRRLAAIGLALAAAAAGPAVLSSSGAQGSDTYRVDAIFDTAKGIIPGQLVKVAGARVGEVEDVSLTHDYKARIEMEVERRFGPFRADASCSIQPEGLLSENFVQCNPGTADAEPLRARADTPPTVPVRATSVPVSLNDLFNIWNVPTRERLTVLVNELGIGLAGRGDDLNEVLRRANPSLTLARQAIGILNRQRSQLASIVTDTDRVVGELANRRDRVADFIDQTARVTSQTAAHSGALSQSIRRLPPLLAAARPALTRLDELSSAGVPLLRQLRVSAPNVNRLVGRLEPFAEAGLPAVRGLDPALRTARRAVRRSRPLMSYVRRFTSAARPLAPTVSSTFVNLRDRGFIENGLKFLYIAAAASARFDRISHILPSHLIFNDCARYSTQPVAGCEARYAGFGARARAGSRTPPSSPGAPRASSAPGAPSPAASAPAGGGPAPGRARAPGAPNVEGLVGQVVDSITRRDTSGQALEDLAGYLLR